MGTKETGFVKADLGPFKCGNCIHSQGGYCEHPEVKADPDTPKESGKVPVSPGDCCNLMRSANSERRPVSTADTFKKIAARRRGQGA